MGINSAFKGLRYCYGWCVW